VTLVERAKNICLTPNTEWPVIAAEPTSTGTLITGYVVPLAAIGAIAGFIGGSLIGRSLGYLGTYRVPLFSGLVLALFVFGMAIVGVFVLSLIINALAPTFGGEQNSTQALKVAVYSYTPAWIAGVLQILPLLGILAIFGALYGLYLLYLGLPRLMKCPEDKAVPYTAVVVVCAIVLSVIITAIGATIVGAGAFATGALSGGLGGALGGGPARPSGSEVQFDKNSALGKLQELGNKLEESGKKMDAAQKRGDDKAQVAAAFEGLGTLFGGGKRVDPVAIDQLKKFVPDTFAGLPKTASSAEKTGIATLMVSKAEATYGDGAGKSVTLEISDTGGVSGLVGLASWAGIEGEKDDDNASEKTQKVGGRLVHERSSKRGGSNEFGLVLGDRFLVSANGRGIGVDELKAAIGRLDLVTLESMKDAGVQK
jgi:Yip1-like protein